MLIPNRKLWRALLLSIALLPLSVPLVAKNVENPNLEPYPLTPELAETLTQVEANASDASTFKLTGIEVTPKTGSSWFALNAVVDSRLNLWNGYAQDLAGKHLGSMEILITELIDEDGNDAYNRAADKPWSSRVLIYNQGGDVYGGSRSARLKNESKGKAIEKVSGIIKLSLPVNMEKYEIKAGKPESTEALLARDDISEAKLRETGISIRHPETNLTFQASIMGFDANGERIVITSTSHGGSKKDFRAYSFSKSTPFDTMYIFIPEKFIDIEIPFTIEIPSEEEA